jgi:hypothetical protein
MIKKILLGIFGLASLVLNAQNSSISPYSFFGLGEVRNASTVENAMMGGIGMYADSVHINLTNPAAYGKLRLATYAGGASHTEYWLEEHNADSQNTSLTTLDYIAMGLPLGRGVAIGFGLQPVTGVGYNLATESESPAGNRVINTFTGDGSINKLYFSVGAQIHKDVSIGATGGFNFGSLEYRRVQAEEDVQFGTLDERNSRVRGFDFNFALNYNPSLTKKLNLYSSFRARTQANLNSENTRTIGSFSTSTGNGVETIDVDLGAGRNMEIKVPTIFTMGIGVGEEKHWFVGGEYSIQDLNDFSNDFLGIDNVGYTEGSKLAVGGFWIPEYNSFNKYFKRVVYRAGFRYHQTGMVVNGRDINDFGITFGLGLPMPSVGNNFSNINIGFELGRKGTSTADLVQENYFKVRIGLSLNDRWFQKTRIN